MAFTSIAKLLRNGWLTVGRIAACVTAELLDDRRLNGLLAIGVDEISYRRGHKYLTCVADHTTGRIVWVAPGRNSSTLQDFFAELGDRKDSSEAVSIDMSGEYQRALRAAVPEARVRFDPFHVCRLAARATDQVRRDECKRPRTLPDTERTVGQRHPLEPAQSPGEPDHPPTRNLARSPAGQPPALPRLHAARRAPSRPANLVWRLATSRGSKEVLLSVWG